MLSYLINVVLLIALLACTASLYFVNRRLRMLRTGQDDIGPMIERFAEVTGEMTESLERLKSDAISTAKQLEEIIGHGQAINTRMERSLLEAKRLERMTTAKPRGRTIGDIDADGGPSMDKPAAPAAADDTPDPRPARPQEAPATKPHSVRRWAPPGSAKSALLSSAVSIFYDADRDAPKEAS